MSTIPTRGNSKQLQRLQQLRERQQQLRKYDPVGSFRFMVEIGHLQVGGFTEVSGLTVETEVFEYAEGGLNQFTYKFPTRTKYVPLVLKRGVTISTMLWEWFDECTQGKISRKDGTIVLYDTRGKVMRRWHFFGAFPTKWVGPELNAASSDVAVEAIELTHHGLYLEYG